MGLSEIRAALNNRAAIKNAFAAIGVVAGVPLCFVGPYFFAFIAWFLLGRVTGNWFEWDRVLLTSCLLIVPLEFLTEIRHQGRTWAEAFKDQGDAYRDLMGQNLSNGVGYMPMGRLVMWRIEGVAATSKGLAAFFQLGPRLIMNGIAHWRHARRTALPNEDRPAEVIAELLTHEHGRTIKELLAPGEKPEELIPVLLWLAHHGWIGIGEKFDRVFLYSEARERFARESRGVS